MEHHIDMSGSLSSSKLKESVKFIPYGSYIITLDKDCCHIERKYRGMKTVYGYRTSQLSYLFDEIGPRKAAYKTSESEIMGKILSIQQDNKKNIKGGEIVKIYKKGRNQNATKRLNGPGVRSNQKGNQGHKGRNCPN